MAMRGPNRKSIDFARQLRGRQTDAETALWNRLRHRKICGCKFVRQLPIGPYICDFVWREGAIVVEVDGGQHADSRRDEVRDQFLREQGYRVLRFWNNDVLSNSDGVLEVIASALSERITARRMIAADRDAHRTG